NITYIFDEPSAGLHPEEVDMLIDMLQNIKANYNTVNVIEHDLLVIQEADEIIEMGPGAGVRGGEEVYQGELEGLKEKEASTNIDHTLKINTSPRQAESFYVIK